MRTAEQWTLLAIGRNRIEEYTRYGLFIAETDEFLLVQHVGDRYDLDGYRVYRRSFIDDLTSDFGRADLIHRSLKLKQQHPAAPPPLELTSMRSLMASAQSAYGVLVIHREIEAADECEVGTIRMSSDESYVLHWLNTDAEWEHDDRAFRYDDITILEFGGAYETTLLAVARDRENDDYPGNRGGR